MKFTREEIDKKNFHIVQPGLQVMPPAHYNAFQTVTDINAVMIGEQVFCTKVWYDDLMKKMS